MSNFKMGGGPNTGTAFDMTITSGGVARNTSGNWRQPPSGATVTLTTRGPNLGSIGVYRFEATPVGFVNEEPVDPVDATQGAYDPTMTQIQYKWDFDDVGSLHRSDRLPAHLRDANTAYGKIVEHYFESGGTYTVTCTATEPSSGRVAVKTTMVNVVAPESIPGVQINYVDPDGIYADAPQGSRNLTSLRDFLVDIVDGSLSGPQLCYVRRGVTISFNDYNWSSAPQMQSAIIMGDPATALANPVIQSQATGLNMWNLQNADPAQNSDLIFVDIDWQGHWDATTERGIRKIGFSTTGANAPNVTQFIGCRFSKFAITFSSNNGLNLQLANCEIDDWGDYGCLLSVMGDYTSFLGTVIKQPSGSLGGGPKDNSVTSDHNTHGPVRWSSCKRPIIMGCDFTSTNGWFTNIHGFHTGQPCVRFLTGAANNINNFAKANIYGNIFEGGQYQLSLHPTNGGTECAPTSSTIHRNIFLTNWWTTAPIYASHTGFAIRNNVAYRADVGQPRIEFRTQRFVQFEQTYPNVYDPLANPDYVEGNTVVNLCTDANAGGNAGVSATQNIVGSGKTVTVASNFIHQPNRDTPDTPYSNIDATNVFTTRAEAYRSYYIFLETTIEALNGGSLANGASMSIPYTTFDPALTRADVDENVFGTAKSGGLKMGSNAIYEQYDISGGDVSYDANNMIITNNTGGTLTGACAVNIITTASQFITTFTETEAPANSTLGGQPLLASDNAAIDTELAGWDDFLGVTRPSSHSRGAMQRATS